MPCCHYYARLSFHYASSPPHYRRFIFLSISISLPLDAISPLIIIAVFAAMPAAAPPAERQTAMAQAAARREDHFDATIIAAAGSMPMMTLISLFSFDAIIDAFIFIAADATFSIF
jgi:hypothetical protein